MDQPKLLDIRDLERNINLFDDSLLPVFKENLVPTKSEYIALVGLLTTVSVKLLSIYNADISILWLVGEFFSSLSPKLLGPISRKSAISSVPT